MRDSVFFGIGIVCGAVIVSLDGITAKMIGGTGLVLIYLATYWAYRWNK